MNQLETLVAEHEFFKGLDREDIRWLAECAVAGQFAPGEYLFQEGDPARRFFAIRQGRVALEIFAPGQGQGPLVIQTIGAGEMVGWSWLVPPYKKRFSARATELTRTLSFDVEAVRARCEQDPRFGYALVRRFSELIGQRLQATRLQLLDVYGTRR